LEPEKKLDTASKSGFEKVPATNLSCKVGDSSDWGLWGASRMLEQAKKWLKASAIRIKQQEQEV
jgi:hypothetical protein